MKTPFYAINAFICQDALRLARVLRVGMQNFSVNPIMDRSEQVSIRGMGMWPRAAGRWGVDFKNARRLKCSENVILWGKRVHSSKCAKVLAFFQ